MTALTEQEGKWVDELSDRLRLIRAGAANAPTEKRREYLQEELARHFKEVPQSGRKRLLNSLLQRFPVAGNVSMPSAAPVSPVIPADETAEQILERLLAATAVLPDDQRAKISRRFPKPCAPPAWSCFMPSPSPARRFIISNFSARFRPFS